MFGIFCVFCGIGLQGADILSRRVAEVLGAESVLAQASPSEALPKTGGSLLRASSSSGSERDSTVSDTTAHSSERRLQDHSGSVPSGSVSEAPANSSEAESQWLTDLLRQEFRRWLTSRSEALFNQLQAEFGQWLTLRGTQSQLPAEDPNRPAWVDAPPGVIDGQYGQTVQAGPAHSLEDCQAELHSEIQKAVASYAEKRFDNPFAHQIPWKIKPLLPEILADQWQQTRLIDFGPTIGRKPMIWLYARLQFTPPVQQEIARQYREALIQSRLHTLAVFGAGLLVLLGISYGVLRWQCNRLYPPKAF